MPTQPDFLPRGPNDVLSVSATALPAKICD